MGKIYWSISEVAQIVGEPISCVRFWSTYFEKYVKPDRSAKQNRLYREADVEMIKQICYLTKVKGLTLEGVAKQLNADKKTVEKRVKAIDSLKEIKSRLTEIKKSL